MISAFVLKCPECLAPQPGATSTCAYCRVPLMWAPSKSISRDDARDSDVEDEPNTELVYFNETVQGGDTHRFRYYPQKLERLRFMWASEAAAECFLLEKFRLGVMMILGETRAPAIVFGRGRGFPFPEAATMTPGLLFSFDVVNVTTIPRRFEGVLRVRAFDDSTIGVTRDGLAVRRAGFGAPHGAVRGTWLDAGFRRR